MLIVNWTDTDFGRGASDKARALDELVAKGLVVVLRDTHNRSADEILSSRLRLYPDSSARFVRNMEPPIAYEDNGPPPDVALIDCEGVLVVAGSYTVDLGKAEKRIQAELKRRASGWGESSEARKARALLYGKGRLAEALALCEAALATAPADAELGAVRGEVLAARAQRERAIHHHWEQGECGRALEEARALREGVTGNPEWAEQADRILAELATPEALHELALDADLEAILRRGRKKGPGKRELADLQDLARRSPDTRVGRRAAELARIAALSVP